MRVNLLLQLANLYQISNQRPQALRAVSDAARLAPTHYDALSLMGALKAATGNPNEGLADLNRAIEVDPNMFSAYFNRGQVHEMLGQREKALADYRRFMQIAPQGRPEREIAQRKINALGG